MDLASKFVDPVKRPARRRIAAGHVITVIGKVLARCEARGFAHDLVALDDELAPIGMFDDPFPSEECDGVLRAVADGDEVDERMRLVGRKRRTTVVVGELVKSGGEAREFAGAGHSANRRVIRFPASGIRSGKAGETAKGRE